MDFKIYILLSAVIVMHVSCKSVKQDEIADIPKLELSFTESPIPLTTEGVNVATNLAYGDHANQVYDIFLPESKVPSPLVIYVHGGGFTHGEKERAYRFYEDEINQLLEQGVAFATIGYRYLQDTDSGVIDCMKDSKYLLQYLRYHAASFNIDPELIALFGQSAGAGTSLWIGLNDDMAVEAAADPVLRESTRIRAIGAIATQATYDILRWEEIFSSYTIDMSRIPPVMMDQLVRFYGITDSKLLETQELKDYRHTVDMLSLLTEDDPPLFIYNDGNDGMPLFTDPQHHPLHAKYLKQYADQMGVLNVTYAPALGIKDDSAATIVDFLVAQLK